jgi:CDP-paratose 2-epimerase
MSSLAENMRILITGGAGFIGSSLAITLKSRLPAARVVSMDNLYRRGSEMNLSRLKAHGVLFHHGDVRKPGDFPSGPFDVLAECSAEPSVLAGTDQSPEYLVESNLLGAFHCLEKARLWRSGFLFLSTSRIYPIQRLESHPWREEANRFIWEDHGTPGISSKGVSELLDMSGTRSLYGFTKYAAEQLIGEYRSAYGLTAVIDRCGVIAGPWQFGKIDQGVAALWVLAHHFRRPLSYIGYGGLGKQVRDFLHIEDLCELITQQISELDRWDGWVGNVSGGASNAASLRDLTVHCRECVGNEVAIASKVENRPGDLRIFIGDCTRLFERTEWRPRRDVRAIIQDIAVWVREHSTALQSSLEFS